MSPENEQNPLNDTSQSSSLVNASILANANSSPTSDLAQKDKFLNSSDVNSEENIDDEDDTNQELNNTNDTNLNNTSITEEYDSDDAKFKRPHIKHQQSNAHYANLRNQFLERGAHSGPNCYNYYRNTSTTNPNVI